MVDVNVDLVYQFFDKKIPGGAVKSEVMPNQHLGEQLRKLVLENLKREKYTHLL